MLSEYVKEFERESKQKDGMIIKLNFNYRSIKIIDALSQRYEFIKELYLNHNQIESLQGIEQFVNLEEFHIKFNYISSLEELDRIKNKQSLRILNLKGNPIEKNSKCCFDFLHNSFPYLNELNENVRYNNSSVSGGGQYLKDNFNSSRGTRSISYSNFNSKNKQKLISNAKELSQMLENTLQRQNSCNGLKSYRTPNKQGGVALIQTGIYNFNDTNAIQTERENSQGKGFNTLKSMQSNKVLYNNKSINGQESSREVLGGILSTRMYNTSAATLNTQSNQQSTINIGNNHSSVNINKIINQNKNNSQNIGIINQFLNTHSSRVNSLEKQIQQESSRKQSQYTSLNNVNNGSIQNKFNNQIQGFQSQLQANNEQRPKSLSNYSTNITTDQYQNNQILRNLNQGVLSNNPGQQSNLFSSRPNMISEGSQMTATNGHQSCLESMNNQSGQQRSLSQYNTNSNYNNSSLARLNQMNAGYQSNLQRNASTSTIISNAINKLNSSNLNQNNNGISANQKDTHLLSSQKAGGVVTEGNSLISFNQSKLHMFQQYQLSFKKDQGVLNSNQKSRQNSEHSIANLNSNKNIVNNNFNKESLNNLLQPTNRQLFPSENQGQLQFQSNSISNHFSKESQQTEQGLQRFVQNQQQKPQKELIANQNLENYDSNQNNQRNLQKSSSAFLSNNNSRRGENNNQNNGNNLVNLYSSSSNNNNNNHNNNHINVLSDMTSIQSRFANNNQQSQILGQYELDNNNFNGYFDKQKAVQSEYTTTVYHGRQQDNLEQNIENQLQQQFNSTKSNNDRIQLNNTHIQYNSQQKINQQNQNQSISFLSNENQHIIPTNNRYSTNDQFQNQQSQQIQMTSPLHNPEIGSMPISTEADIVGYSSQLLNNQVQNNFQTQSDVIQPAFSTTSVEQIPISSSISLNPNLQGQQQGQLQIRNSASNESLFSKTISNNINQTTATFAKQSKLTKDNHQEVGPFKFKKSQNQMMNGLMINQKLASEIQQSYNNYPLDTQNNPLDTDLSFDNNLVASQNKQRKRALSSNGVQQNGNNFLNPQSNQQLTSQNQFTQQSQQFQSNFNEMASLNLSRISHIGGKSFMNISIPHMRFDGGVFESQANFQIEDDPTAATANNINPNASTNFMSLPAQQRKSIIISEIINQGKQQQQNQQNAIQNYQTQPENLQNLQRQSINLSFLNKSAVLNECLNQHIDNIDTDIEQLAIFFYQKSLKEKAFKSLFYLKAFTNLEQKNNQQATQQTETHLSSKYNSSMKNSTHTLSVKNNSPHPQNTIKQESAQHLRSNSSLNNLHQSRQSPNNPQISSPNLSIINNINNKQNTLNSQQKCNIIQQGQELPTQFQRMTEQHHIPHNQLQSMNDCSGLIMHQNTFNYSDDEMLLTQQNIPVQRDQSPPQQNQQSHQQQKQQQQYASQLSGVAKEIETEEISFDQIKQQSHLQMISRQQQKNNDFYQQNLMNPTASITNNPLDEVENDPPIQHLESKQNPQQQESNFSCQQNQLYQQTHYQNEEDEDDHDIQIKIQTANEYYENFLKIKIFFEWKTFTQNRKIKDKMFLNLSNIKKGLIALNSGRGDLTTNRTQKETFRQMHQSSTSSHKQQQSQSEFEQIQSTKKKQLDVADNRMFLHHNYDNMKNLNQQNCENGDPFANSIPQFEESSSDFYASTNNNENIQQFQIHQQQQQQTYQQGKYNSNQSLSSINSTTPTNNNILNEIKTNYQQLNNNEDKYQRLKLNPSYSSKDINKQIIDQNNNRRKELKNCNLPLSNNIFAFKKNSKAGAQIPNENMKKF